ncbi:type II toxin-antitoxin system PemK/MazF family toxin [Herbiconiux ginsengi]|uniref:PemK-like, MazF-like toxin of type II toxin-antitoxin system n=1 Tax=Herbiconiux ginsengi TaxID=381665 RepID=A0A1H3S679_9MICO|nr:type II toxin-antitoxin system PemK/MazF family toxin [Herbiconiux ginsengi]SDZ33105.1 PemK-like, MazF-like toxin of type II toxin-antitoxin system [Herbiconiux ginsengi]
MSGRIDDQGGSPGRYGASATVEIDPRSVGRVGVAYNPVTDGDADPGEIVWTWVPYEENDGRGKDRPVLVVATEPRGTVLAMQLTSKPHDDQYDVGIGSGAWDSAGRPSWVRLERVFRLHQDGMRREAVALDAARFALVAAALQKRFGWRAGDAPAVARRSGVMGVFRRLFRSR